MAVDFVAYSTANPRTVSWSPLPLPTRIAVESRQTIDGKLNFNEANGRALLALLRIDYDTGEAMPDLPTLRRALMYARSTVGRRAPTIAQNTEQAFRMTEGDGGMLGGARVISLGTIDPQGLSDRLDWIAEFVEAAAKAGADRIAIC